MKRRVVITGLGVVSPLANQLQAFWGALLEGQSGIRPIEGLDVSDLPTRFGGEVAPDFDILEWVDKRAARRMDPSSHYAVAASHMALEDSGVDLSQEDVTRIGVTLGTGIGGVHEFESGHAALIQRGPERVSPFVIPKLMSNAPSGEVSIRLGLQGPNFVTTSACASSGHAIGSALRIIQYGDAEVMLSGGTEAAITRFGMAGFSSLRALSRRNDDPQSASRPFDRDRDGFVMGDGAGVLVLEELEHARQRGARIYAEILGAGWTGDAHHITAPAEDGRGAVRAMAMAMEDGGISPDQIDYINAHGTSTEINDAVESLAIRKLFGDQADQIAISSTKSMVGHLLGAAGGVELVVTALSIHDGRIHPTRNLENPDPACDLDYVPGEARELPVKAALSNSFGFGGHNSAILLGRFEGS